ncbi:hypothetical protein TCON_2703 [Astathelohania contejeani]|uniref:Uncharacterized protein n=1 Tax=Astathelohania contejeani TaxID=164912 RepID=A0ABQ7HV95_9MICR|nr:hypothetical protein TCON_2703 [Thelohania contejeani]
MNTSNINKKQIGMAMNENKKGYKIFIGKSNDKDEESIYQIYDMFFILGSLFASFLGINIFDCYEFSVLLIPAICFAIEKIFSLYLKADHNVSKNENESIKHDRNNCFMLSIVIIVVYVIIGATNMLNNINSRCLPLYFTTSIIMVVLFYLKGFLLSRISSSNVFTYQPSYVRTMYICIIFFIALSFFVFPLLSFMFPIVYASLTAFITGYADKYYNGLDDKRKTYLRIMSAVFIFALFCNMGALVQANNINTAYS